MAQFLNQSVTIPNDRTPNSVTQADYDEWRLHFGVTTLTPMSNVPADASGNGVTDINDYIIIRNNFLGTGKTLATGDINGDTVVNFADFRLWKMGRSGVASANFDFELLTAEFTQSVPEAGGLALALFARSR